MSIRIKIFICVSILIIVGCIIGIIMLVKDNDSATVIDGQSFTTEYEITPELVENHWIESDDKKYHLSYDSETGQIHAYPNVTVDEINDMYNIITQN